MSTTTTKDPVLQEHTRLVRTVESNLKLKLEDRGEIAFRSALLARTAATIAAMNQTLTTRLYEAVCEVEFPHPEIIEFRRALQRQIAKNMAIKPLPKAPQPQA
jgi:hypothetical protein